MRTRTWILIACGIIGVALSVARGSDSSFKLQHSLFDRSSADKALEYYSRGGAAAESKEKESVSADEASEQPLSAEQGVPLSKSASRYVRKTDSMAKKPRTLSNILGLKRRTEKKPNTLSVSQSRGEPNRTADQPKVKNYFTELFGNEGSSQRVAERPAATAPTQGVAKSATKPLFTELSQSRQPQFLPRPERSAARGTPRLPDTLLPKTAESAKSQPRASHLLPNLGDAKTAAPIIDAKHEQPHGKAPQDVIQQIRLGRKPVSSFQGPSEPAATPSTASKVTVSGSSVAADKSRNGRLSLTSGRGGLTLPQRKTSTNAKSDQSAPTSQSPAARHESPSLAAAAIGNQPIPTVTLQWVKQGDINVGKECRCDLVVRNTSQTPASDVTVDAFFPQTVRLTDVNPSPTESADHLSWHFDSLAPGETRAIQIRMIPSRRGQLATAARVRLTGTASGLFNVEEPMLEIAMKGPSEVRLGDPASQIVTLSNPGTGVAPNVSIEVSIPEGLEHLGGEQLKMEIGSLGPGESRTVRLSLAAVAGGEHPLRLVAKAGTDMRKETMSIIHVIAPSMKVAIDGPGLRFLGRKAKYAVTVSNDGAAPTSNVRVLQQVPKGFQFVAADKGGEYDPSTRTIQWFLGGLDVNASEKLNVELTAKELGDFTHVVRAKSEHGVGTGTTIDTRVDGTASLVLEIVDLDDPVEVGAETAYEIRISNTGSKAAQNVAITSELPEGAKLLSAKGPASHVAENGVVVFKPVPQLAPGKTAIFQVHVRGTQEGNLRFRTQLTSDSVQQPLVLEELTRFYAD